MDIVNFTMQSGQVGSSFSGDQFPILAVLIVISLAVSIPLLVLFVFLLKSLDWENLCSAVKHRIIDFWKFLISIYTLAQETRIRYKKAKRDFFVWLGEQALKLEAYVNKSIVGVLIFREEFFGRIDDSFWRKKNKRKLDTLLTPISSFIAFIFLVFAGVGKKLLHTIMSFIPKKITNWSWWPRIFRVILCILLSPFRLLYRLFIRNPGRSIRYFFSGRVITSFFWSKKWVLWAYGISFFLFGLLYYQVNLSVQFNDWYGSFYDLLQNRQDHTKAEYNGMLWVFTWLALKYVLAAMVTQYTTRFYGLRWREAITFGYLPEWFAKVKLVPQLEGTAQRIQEDPQRFARIIESLGLQFVRMVMKLAAFLPILYGLSKGIDIWIFKGDSGSLVWLALLVSIGGTVISWKVGGRLPGLEYKNQVAEAAFRDDLVLFSKNLMPNPSLGTFFELFTGVKYNYYRLYWNYGYFDLWSNSFFQFMAIIPFLFVGPIFFAGIVSMGVMMQVGNAFGEVQGSFSILIDNWTSITEVRSINLRLREFEANMNKYKLLLT